MAGRSWEPTKKGAKDLNRYLSKGKTVYTINTTVTNLRTGDGIRTCNAHTVDGRSWITGEWMFGHMSVSTLLAQCGTAHEQPPADTRASTHA